MEGDLPLAPYKSELSLLSQLERFELSGSDCQLFGSFINKVWIE